MLILDRIKKYNFTKNKIYFEYSLEKIVIVVLKTWSFVKTINFVTFKTNNFFLAIF